MNRVTLIDITLTFILSFFITMSFLETATAQTADVFIEYTAQNQAYWQVYVNDQPVSQHQTEREAYEEANRQLAAVDYAAGVVQVRHNAVIEVEGYVDLQLPDDPVEPDPDPVTVTPVMVPGASLWQAIPEGLITRQFRVLNDDWAITSDNMWLYAYNVSVDDGTGYLVHRPAGSNWQGPIPAETTPLTDEQVEQLIVKLTEQ